MERRQAGSLGLPRASLHGHRHPQRAASVLRLSSVQVDALGGPRGEIFTQTAHTCDRTLCFFFFSLLPPSRFTFPSLHPDWMLLLSFMHTHVTITVTLALLFVPKVLAASRARIRGECIGEQVKVLTPKCKNTILYMKVLLSKCYQPVLSKSINNRNVFFCTCQYFHADRI